jgi:pimeloyl-ACP methyl ester carboxylesterase
MKLPDRTPPLREAHGDPGPGGLTPGGIAEARYLRLGGLDQWVILRGESLANPPLIVLHGGPGLAEAPLFLRYNAALETVFTVVHWDQRGSAKSFDARIPRSTMTVAQFLTDLDELVNAVCERVGQRRVAIFGHSWGTALGALYASRHADKVAAYVGCAQISDWAASESLSYAYALAEAQRRGNRRALKDLRAMGPPPHPARCVFTQRTWLARFDGQTSPRSLWLVGRALLFGPQSSILDLPRLVRGARFSMDAMWAEVITLNLAKQVPELRMPVFFFIGRRDHIVFPETSVAYFEALTAPSKKLVWFEHSGHEPFLDEPARFNAAMLETVRPALG